MTNTMLIFTIVVYMVFMIVIGINLAKQNTNTSEYYLGGRKLGPFVTAMSAEASDMSSWLLMGLPGVALASGLADAFWTAAGLAIGTYLNWLIVAKRLRCYSEINNSDTIPDFFSNRFRDKSGALLAISAIVIIFFFVPYTASGFAAVGKLFNSLFGVDYHVALIVGAIVIVIYTAIGGFLAASTTDFIQSLVMTVALFVVTLYGIENAGGFGPVIDNVKELPGYFSLTEKYDPATGAAVNYGAITSVSMIAWGLGYFGMPHVLLRFMAIEDENKLKLSRRIASVWVVISMAIAVFIGVTGYSFVKNNGIAIDITNSSQCETIIIEYAKSIGGLDTFAAVLAGLIISGILAATMSTADSQLLAASSSMSENIVRRFFIKNMSDRVSMIFARATVCLISVISVFLAWDPNSSVFEIVSFAWAGFGAAFGPLMLCALFWKRTTKWGALAGMIAGGVMVILWNGPISAFGAANGIGILTIYELLPAFIVSLAVTVIVSLVTPKPSKEIIDEFELVGKKG